MGAQALGAIYVTKVLEHARKVGTKARELARGAQALGIKVQDHA